MPTPSSCPVCASSLTVAYKDMYDDRYGHPGLFSILQCNSCDSLITDPPLTVTDIGPLYTNYYPRHTMDIASVQARGMKTESRKSNFIHWWHGNHKIHHMLPKAGNGTRVLDIGCGDGASLIELNRNGYIAHGIETDEHVAVVRDGLKLTIHIGTVEDCTFEKKSYDYIIANQVIEHIIDLDSFIIHAKNFLKPGGYIILSTPNANSIYRKVFGKKWAHWHIPYHQHIVSKKALRILLEKHSFTFVFQKTVSPTTWMIHTLNRLRHTPIRGQKNPLWLYEADMSHISQKNATGSAKSASENPKKHSLALNPKKWLYNTILAIISLCNRVVDIFQGGDCIVIQAQLKDIK